MSEYVAPTPIPKELNLDDWYEVVPGDHIPARWVLWTIFRGGATQRTLASPVNNVHTTAWIQEGYRLFTATPVPTAIKRIRAAETQQDELPVEDQAEIQLTPEVDRIEERLTRLEAGRKRDWEANVSARQLHNQWIGEQRASIRHQAEEIERQRKFNTVLQSTVDEHGGHIKNLYQLLTTLSENLNTYIDGA